MTRTMIRPAFVLTAALSVATALAAAERATFVLTDGERMSGEVVFHTEARTNIREDKNEFNLKVASGREVPIPFDQVVYIDFVGGQPAAAEFKDLPDNGHFLTLRNGESRKGRLLDFIGGTTVKWDTGSGVTTLPITDVRRVYLKLDRVREMFNVSPGGGGAVSPTPTTPVPTPGRGQTNNRSRTITVRAANEWTDTGINVRSGQSLSFSASGEVFFSREPGASGGPAGKMAPASRFPVPTVNGGALIGKIGPNGRPFAIGGNTEPIRMPASGRLMLGVNDDDFNDNSGFFDVVVTPR